MTRRKKTANITSQFIKHITDITICLSSKLISLPEGWCHWGTVFFFFL